MGTRSYEVITEDGVRYRRNGRHLRKGRESYSRGTLTHNSNLTKRYNQQGTMRFGAETNSQGSYYSK